jgi:hypothetical protein
LSIAATPRGAIQAREDVLNLCQVIGMLEQRLGRPAPSFAPERFEMLGAVRPWSDGPSIGRRGPASRNFRDSAQKIFFLIFRNIRPWRRISSSSTGASRQLHRRRITACVVRSMALIAANGVRWYDFPDGPLVRPRGL